MAKYFKNPFAVDGDRTSVPELQPSDGSVNWDTGFPIGYQEDPTIDPTTALNIPRDQFNEIIYQVTLALQQNQQFGFPEFITTSDNGGTAFPYSINATVRYNNVNYYSLVDSNTALPTDNTKWGVVTYSVFQTGDMLLWESNTLRTGGWLWANGQTIGDASSNATARENADTFILFDQIWNNFSNAVRPILDSSGVASTRGANSLADFNAHKQLPLRDMRDVVPAGLGTMGGITDRGLLTTNTSGGVNGVIFGATGGLENNSLDITQMPPHNHTVGYIQTGVSGAGATPVNNVNPAGGLNVTTSSAGGTSGSVVPHNNVQPTTICNFIIKL